MARVYSPRFTHPMALLEPDRVARLVVVDGVVWREERTWCEEVAAHLSDDLQLGWPLPPEWDGSFAAALLQPEDVTFGIEPAGLRRLYWTQHCGVFIVSSLQLPCALGAGLDVDPVGVAELLGHGQTIGRRSLFKGVREVWPGEGLRMGLDGSLQDRALEHAVPATSAGVVLSMAEAVDLLVPLLRSAARRAVDSYERPAIALSSGVDSRLLLGALSPEDRPVAAISYGDPREAEVLLAGKVARLARVPHHVVDLRGRLFAGEADARRDARRCEATWHPAWLAVNQTVEQLNCEAVLLGDVTDSLQVRVEALWGRRQRVTRQLRKLLAPHREPSLPARYDSPLSWWEHHRVDLRTRVLRRQEELGLCLPADVLSAALDDDLAEMWDIGELSRYVNALDLEEALQIALARQNAGSQVNAVGGGAVGHSVFGTRHLVRAARGVGMDLRSNRALIREISRAVLPRSLRMLPTATVPLVPVTAPALLQNGVWAARFVADLLLRRANAALGGRLPRERVVRTLELPVEYRSAGGDFFLAGDWSRSGVFSTSKYSSVYREMLSGERVPMVPVDPYRAVRVDELLAKAGAC